MRSGWALLRQEAVRGGQGPQLMHSCEIEPDDPTRSADMKTRMNIALVLVVSALIACGGQIDEHSENERTGGTFSPEDDAGASANSTDAAQQGSNNLPDASVHVGGSTCSSREVVDSCTPSTGIGPLGPDLEAFIEKCVGVHGSRCITFNATVDGMGCVTDLFLEYGTDKEVALQCIADAVAIRRWPCAQEGSHRFMLGCTLER